jgi:hypothetical protein
MPALAAETKSITFRELPIELQLISFCESGARQHYNNGKLVVGPFKEIGIFQIHPIHFKKALKMGYNIYDPNGNMAFALHLFNRNGLSDWFASKRCWSKHLALAKTDF